MTDKVDRFDVDPRDILCGARMSTVPTWAEMTIANEGGYVTYDDYAKLKNAQGEKEQAILGLMDDNLEEYENYRRVWLENLGRSDLDIAKYFKEDRFRAGLIKLKIDTIMILNK